MAFNSSVEFIWQLLVCFSTSYLLTQAKITERLRWKPDASTIDGISKTKAYNLFSCIMCAGFWVALVYFFFVKRYGILESLERSVVSAVINYVLYLGIEWLETKA